jgi:hypothetical protein
MAQFHVAILIEDAFADGDEDDVDSLLKPGLVALTRA